MQTRAALLRQVPGEWEVCDVELDEPREHEVLVRMGAAHGGRDARRHVPTNSAGYLSPVKTNMISV